MGNEEKSQAMLLLTRVVYLGGSIRPNPGQSLDSPDYLLTRAVFE